MAELRIVAGDPTAEELAALTVVLLRAAAPAPSGAPAPPSRWRSGGRPAAPGRPGPGAWRASTLP